MNTTDTLLDAVRAKLGLTSDNQLAIRFGITRQRVSSYRSGIHALSEERALEICAILGRDPGPILIQLQAERARKSGRFSVADALDSLLRKLGPTIAAALLLFAGFPAPADAFSAPALVRQHLTDNANYAKYVLRCCLICIKNLYAISFIIQRALWCRCSCFNYTV